MVLFAALRSARRDRDHNGKSTVFQREVESDSVKFKAARFKFNPSLGELNLNVNIAAR